MGKDEEVQKKLKEVNVALPTIPYAGIPILVKKKEYG